MNKELPHYTEELTQEQIAELYDWYDSKEKSLPLPEDFSELDCLDLYNEQQIAEFEADHEY